ncbi:MAG: AgmX/PglI C-terminal domain-containing protein [Pseudobdellovibrionaceae bacterium]
MKIIFAVLVTNLFFLAHVKAQTLSELKQQYEEESPLGYQELKPKQVVEPGTSDKTPAEEELADMKAKELEEKEAQEEKAYLNTDFHFFQSLNLALDEDELDKLYKEKQLAENIEKLKSTDKTVKTEITTTAPVPMTPKEAEVVDEKRTLILKKISINGQYVRACILQHKKDHEFKGTSMTLAWEVEPSGKVTHTQMKSTDVESKEIQDCVLKSLAEWNFGEAMKAQTKNSHIEYTYRFVKENKEAAATTKPAAPAVPAPATATLPN